MAIEIMSFPMKNGGSFHSYVNVYQRVTLQDGGLHRFTHDSHDIMMTSDFRRSRSWMAARISDNIFVESDPSNL